ncbi:MAG: tail fiber domain-containing protein [Flavobacteriales bacterium]|nr:tail fiber domain-containing protein [Flavobacteriales bacterium]
MGQKYSTLDNTDVVIQWSDNPADSPWGVDRMRFIFTNGYNGSTTGARSMEGLEGMRLYPKNDNEMNVGIGDFYAYGGDPTERLHVRDGRVRIQQLPDDPETELPYKVMVVDDSNDPLERGVVKWKNISGFGDCTWRLQPNNDVASVYNGSTCPWNYDNFVGVGVQYPKAKLQVEYDGSGPNFTGAVTISTLKSTNQGGWGVAGFARTPFSTQFASTSFYGVGGFGSNAKYTYGVSGIANNGAPGIMAQDVIGVTGTAIASENAVRTVGVYGVASGASNGNDWAAWFDGEGFLGALSWNYSDENLKIDVENLSSSEMAATLMQLHPKSYSFNTEEYPYLNLPAGAQFGLISQEVDSVFPNLVKDVVRPEQVDSLGNVIEPELQFKAMNYQGFIPVLIAGFQAQQQQIAAMQQQLDACCAANQGLAPQGYHEQRDGQDGNLQEQRLLIFPNPVADLTTLEYYVPQAGKVSLSVSTSDGKPLGMLREEQSEPGAYSYAWNTTKLAAGTYFCTYLLDGAVVVKRAVKVSR